jgi:DNA-binding PadR family transcriptional regulator
MKVLSRTEEMILLAVHALAPHAYGLAVGMHLKKITGKPWSVGATYIPLDRLEKAGLLASSEGDPTAQRGGRRKRFYRLTPKGLKALGELKRMNEALWAAGPDFGAA